jgi:glycosyltransferase involved in cell wall biosynthesis
MRVCIEESNTIFVYWGKKGGGARLAHEIYLETLNLDPIPKVFFSFRNTFKYDGFKVGTAERRIDVKLVDSYIRSLASPSFYSSLLDFWNVKTNKAQKIKIVILMSSPLDTVLGPILAKRFDVWRVVHDFPKHEGDLWPTNRQIRKWVKRDNIVVLSNYIGRKISSYVHKKEMIVGSLQRAVAPKIKSPMINEDYCLVIGRGRKYQIPANFELLIKQLPLKLCLAGANFPEFEVGNTVVLKRWLHDYEFENLVKHAKFVICFYSQASQSGVIEQALSHGVPILASRVGAFQEQVREGIDGFFIEGQSENDLQILIDKTLNLDRSRVGENRNVKTLLRTLLDQEFFEAKN